jgi:hypothetical protein
MPRDVREDAPLFNAAPISGLAGQFNEWLIREARFFDNNETILKQFCDRVAQAGIPIDRVSLHQRAFHPQYRGVMGRWRRNTSITGSKRRRFISRARCGW